METSKENLNADMGAQMDEREMDVIVHKIKSV